MRLRPTRRRARARGGLAAAGLGAGAYAATAARDEREGAPRGRRAERETPLPAPRATPIQRFEIARPDRRRFGALEFRSGLALASDYAGFGGLSSLILHEGGARLLAASDVGDWFAARIERREGALVGLADLVTAPMLGPQGELMRRSRRYDCEALTLAPDGSVYAGFERVHEIWRYDLSRKGLAARAQPVAALADVKRLSDNKSLEALAAAPAGHRLDGLLIAIAERPPRGLAQEEGPATPAWAIPTSGRAGGFAFSVARVDEFDLVDCAFLPDSDLVVLERRFRWLEGVRSRLRRIQAAAIRPGARVEGELLLDADMGFDIDNLEGLAVWRDAAGGTMLTLVSDDNFNWFQRTLLLEFRYRG
jgi:hypothetical protein